jgi:hypothetical protein
MRTEVPDCGRSNSCTRGFPGVERVASKLFEGSSLEQMTLDVEGVVDSELNIQKALNWREQP